MSVCPSVRPLRAGCVEAAELSLPSNCFHQRVATHSTLCPPKKVSRLKIDNNFGKCGPIFKTLSPSDSHEKSLCIHHRDFHLTCNMLLHYLVKVENPKMLRNFHVKFDNLFV